MRYEHAAHGLARWIDVKDVAFGGVQHGIRVVHRYRYRWLRLNTHICTRATIPVALLFGACSSNPKLACFIFKANKVTGSHNDITSLNILLIRWKLHLHTSRYRFGNTSSHARRWVPPLARLVEDCPPGIGIAERVNGIKGHHLPRLEVAFRNETLTRHNSLRRCFHIRSNAVEYLPRRSSTRRCRCGSEEGRVLNHIIGFE
mmetsp:Transcript_3534/g.6457  ORF Transcript_3534/g.6457 Transcript_3534/m.6457 type:complete len:202 (+) Transcript_3534:658-1263(+)